MRPAASPRIPARDCVDWCGHIEGEGFSIAGNMLAGAAVLDETAEAYARKCALPLPRRLIAALKAGEAAAATSAASSRPRCVIYGEEEWSDTRPARRRSRRAARRTGAAGAGQPRTLGALPRSILPSRDNPGRDHRPRSDRRRHRRRTRRGEMTADAALRCSKSKICASSFTATGAAAPTRSIGVDLSSPAAQRSASSANPAAARA